MDLPEEAGALFELVPEEFTAARDRLARELNKQGDSGAAAAVKALKRPSVAAHALNLVARRHGYLVQRLLDADERLRTATSRTAMEEAKGDRQQAIAAIGSQAAALLGEQDRPVTAQVKERITQTLLAVGTDDQTRDQLGAGTLLKEASPGGFGGPVPVFQDEPVGGTQDTERAGLRRIEKLRGEAEARRAEAQRLRVRAERARRESEELAQASANALKRSEGLVKQAAAAEHDAQAMLAEAEKLQSPRGD